MLNKTISLFARPSVSNKTDGLVEMVLWRHGIASVQQDHQCPTRLIRRDSVSRQDHHTINKTISLDGLVGH
jgi:hypothetical protein